MEVKTSRQVARSAPSGVCQTYYVDESSVAAVQEAMPSEDVLRRVADEFNALADPTRLKLLFALSLRELCVCDLSCVTQRSLPAVSQQLQKLRRMGLVRYRTSGKLAYYRLHSPLVRRLLRSAIRRCSPEDGDDS